MQKPEDIIVTYGTDPSSMTHKLVEAAELDKLIGNPDAKIVLKPNLVVGVTPEGGATTHPEIAVAIIEYLQEKGFSHIIIEEGSWVGDHTDRGFRANGYYDIGRKYHVDIVDGQKDQYETIVSEGISMQICKTVMDCDFLISLPVLKGHCQTLMTCALKNMKGVLSNKSKRSFHALGLMKPIAALNAYRHADFVVVDSLNGDMDFEEGGNPVQTNRMFTARDSVLCDAFGASLMGFNLKDIEYIGLAEKYGAGSADLSHANIIELNEPQSVIGIHPTGYARDLARNTLPKDACSACFGNLIHALKRLDENGGLDSLPQRICIGQGYKEVEDPSLIGVGNCTRHLGSSLKGCPPSASEMLEYLENL
ncbi:MAG: DUF362 domain-containing protein [Spirochaetaceae bacterium]|jgi:uncharacterized protein (DUF362 family)|nr:DUF362 domain-containing protein [Spirochaetaceae bacterium]